jgi:hypothetical protein
VEQEVPRMWNSGARTAAGMQLRTSIRRQLSTRRSMAIRSTQGVSYVESREYYGEACPLPRFRSLHFFRELVWNGSETWRGD